MDFLSKIIEAKQQEIDAHKKVCTIGKLLEMAKERGDYRGFGNALRQDGINIIAEIKRASPSKGDIRVDLDPAELARSYEAGGAACLSVLTEHKYFKGGTKDLKKARAACTLPVLRKDFIFTDYQVAGSAACGADALLLIVRILEKEQLRDLFQMAKELGLDALVEVFTEQELETALDCGADLIGINNRNLQTFETDLEIARRIFRAMPAGVTAVAASGVFSAEDIRTNLEIGMHAFLIGESLVRSDDPVHLLQELRHAGN